MFQMAYETRGTFSVLMVGITPDHPITRSAVAVRECDGDALMAASRARRVGQFVEMACAGADQQSRRAGRVHAMSKAG